MADPVRQPTERRVIALPDSDLPEVTVEVRRSRRARHVRLHVDESGAVTASVPQRFPAGQVDGIVLERTAWLRDALTRMDLAAQSTRVDLQLGDPVRLLGRWLPSQLQVGGRPRCALVDGRVELVVPEGGDPYDVLVRWYRAQARIVLGERVALWAGAHGLRAGSISIRDQRTRWGSCTHDGNLSFNWRLVLAPLWVLDAIVVHELCHIDELNHSSRFWALLDERYPEHAQASHWLQLHGAALRVSRPRARASDADDLLSPVRPRRGRRVTAAQNTIF